MADDAVDDDVGSSFCDDNVQSSLAREGGRDENYFVARAQINSIELPQKQFRPLFAAKQEQSRFRAFILVSATLCRSGSLEPLAESN